MDDVPLDKGKITKRALFWSNIFFEPLSTLYATCTFILCKDLDASPFQIALLMTLKPVVAIFSFYWSSRSRGRLKRNVLGANILMRAPFLLCPWIDSAWYVIFASVNYMLFYRAGTPAWMEILKRNVKEGERGRTFSWSSAIGYAEGVFLAIAMGSLLDRDPSLCKILFSAAAVIGFLGAVAQAKVPVSEEAEPREQISLKEFLIQPWRDSLDLMWKRKDFAAFHWSYMICGFALMLIYPALPLFAVQELGISHIQMMTAISVAKGFGYVVSAPLWGRWMEKIPIQRFARTVFLVVALFPLLMGLAKWHIFWFYVAYFWYGVGQGGSHLVWNMSGPHFAGKEESARYTGVGVVMVGLRGAVGPPLGNLLLGIWGTLPLLGLGTLLCLCSSFYIQKKKALAAN